MSRLSKHNDRWYRYFLKVAFETAAMSKDQSTHVGAVIANEQNAIVSVGFNSFPSGIRDDVPERQTRPEKYNWFAHAERNSIYKAAEHGTKVGGCTMYTNGMPCSDCGIAVIQAGIKKIVLHRAWPTEHHNPKDGPDSMRNWTDSCARTEQMFRESGIDVYHYEEKLGIQTLYSGKMIDV